MEKMQKILGELRANPEAMRIVKELFELLFEEPITINTPTMGEVSDQTGDLRIKKTIENHMARLGIPHHIIGYSYMLTAFTKLVKDPSLKKGITKKLYPQIAMEYGTTSTRVERTIRHAIEVGVAHCGEETLNNYFGNSVFKNTKPTNRHFLVTISDVIRDELA